MPRTPQAQPPTVSTPSEVSVARAVNPHVRPEDARAYLKYLKDWHEVHRTHMDVVDERTGRSVDALRI